MKPYHEQSGITIYHGDSRDILPLLDVGLDAIITDPPYDQTTHEGARRDAKSRLSPIDFSPIDPSWVVPMLLSTSCSGWIICFCSMEMLGDYKRNAGEWWVRSGFWHRTNGTPQFSGDRPAQPGEGLVIMHGPNSKKSWSRGGHQAFWETSISSGGLHPTGKPLKLMQMLVNDFTEPGQLILDPFMGSGTTLLAAKNLGRKAIGIEIEEKYCEIAARRLRQETLF